jgi:catechol 2,3-dioxygenase-like lactoylglutathione lyase family enzyme
MNLNQITLPAVDLTPCIAFYKTLGLRLIVHSHARYARFECPVGDATFSLHQVEKMPEVEGAWVYFELENLDERVQELLGAGLVFEELPNDKSWLWREAHLKDPAGNRVILFYAGSNRKNPPWRLDSV